MALTRKMLKAMGIEEEKIDQIIDITEKISQDAIEDPSDIPQIKKFFRYYLPTTIKLLNAYDRMSSQGIEGENIDKSMANINEMLDAAIVAFKKHLDSLFANQAAAERESRLSAAIDSIHRVYGRDSLLLAAQGDGSIRSAREHQSPHYTTLWEDIPPVKIL